MMRFWLVTLTSLFLLAPSAAEARKVALIIGNGDYANTSRLVNPANDIRIIAASAKQAGFDDVTIAADLAVNDFQKAMRESGCLELDNIRLAVLETNGQISIVQRSDG